MKNESKKLKKVKAKEQKQEGEKPNADPSSLGKTEKKEGVKVPEEKEKKKINVFQEKQKAALQEIRNEILPKSPKKVKAEAKNLKVAVEVEEDEDVVEEKVVSKKPKREVAQELTEEEIMVKKKSKKSLLGRVDDIEKNQKKRKVKEQSYETWKRINEQIIPEEEK